MHETPLRIYLRETNRSAEQFAQAHDFSPWSVRHWARGDKMPKPRFQRRLAIATSGIVTPVAWAAWVTARPVSLDGEIA